MTEKQLKSLEAIFNSPNGEIALDAIFSYSGIYDGGIGSLNELTPNDFVYRAGMRDVAMMIARVAKSIEIDKVFKRGLSNE